MSKFNHAVSYIASFEKVSRVFLGGNAQTLASGSCPRRVPGREQARQELVLQHGKLGQAAFRRDFEFAFNQGAGVLDEFLVRHETVSSHPIARQKMLDVGNVP